MISEIGISVRYSEVDKMGIVYYSRYLEYFEIGRANWLLRYICNYEELETNYKIGLPVIKYNVIYKRPTKYQDIVVFKTTYNTSQLPKF